MEVLTANSKTVLSIDFSRDVRCLKKCSYCYVDNMERIYPAYAIKVKRNSQLAASDPDKFAQFLNKDWAKCVRSKSQQYTAIDNKFSVRCYGGGDYTTGDTAWLSQLDFNVFMISKSLTYKRFYKDIANVLQLSNLQSLVLSFDTSNLHNLHNVLGIEDRRIKYAFTGTSDEFRLVINEVVDRDQIDIFFNTERTKVGKVASAQYTQACPCDSGQLAHAKSCTICSKCWSGITQ